MANRIAEYEPGRVVRRGSEYDLPEKRMLVRWDSESDEYGTGVMLGCEIPTASQMLLSGCGIYSLGDLGVGYSLTDIDMLRQAIESQRDESRELAARVAELEERICSQSTSRDYFASKQALETVKSLTEELLGTGYELIEREDCEIAGDRHYVFRVPFGGSIDDMVQLNGRWHFRLIDIPENIRGLFRLSLYAKK